jgi:hypothetical protein
MEAITRTRWQLLSPYLDRALDLPADERASWIASLRDTDHVLADQLQTLIEEQESARRDGFLSGAPVSRPAVSVAGQRIGGYRLVAPIGRGGMGTVWLARRSDGRFEGTAAIKLLNIGLIGRGAETRFKREGSILARLKHPHIAQLIDAGISALDQPYLVLEHVEGAHIDE